MSSHSVSVKSTAAVGLMSSPIDVVIIGGGWSGLYTLKSLIEDGIRNVIVIEASDELGGVWRFRENEPGGVHEHTYASSSKHYLHASDFPFTSDTAEFPHHSIVLRHLKRYATHFGLHPFIRFRRTVVRCERIAESEADCVSMPIRWRLHTVTLPTVASPSDTKGSGDCESSVIECSRLVVCSGTSTVPYDPSTNRDSVFYRYRGPSMHSHSYKRPDPEIFKDKTVLIVGGGENASDIAVAVSGVAKHVFMSIRDGQWFQDRLLGGPQCPADMTATWIGTRFDVIHRALIPFAQPMMEEWWGQCGSGVNEWLPSNRTRMGLRDGWGDAFFNKSRSELMTRIAFGAITPKGAVDQIELIEPVEPKPEVTATDSNDAKQPRSSVRPLRYRFHFAGDPLQQFTTEIDVIVYCSGYRPHFPFFAPTPPPSSDATAATVKADLPIDCDARRRYRLIFPLSDPNALAFVGFVRPFITSIPMCAEIQARTLARVWSGRVPLPSAEIMSEELRSDWIDRAQRFPYDVGRNLRPLLVDPFRYCNSLANWIGVAPNWFDLICDAHRPTMNGVLRAVRYALAPYSPFLFRLHDRHFKAIDSPTPVTPTAATATVRVKQISDSDSSIGRFRPTQLTVGVGFELMESVVIPHPVAMRIRNHVRSLARAVPIGVLLILIVCHW